MTRYRLDPLAKAKAPRWIVIQGLQWQLIEVQRLEPGTDVRSAMRSTIDRLAGEGWRTESQPLFGFCFICRNGERRLLQLTEHDPADTRLQSFNPHRNMPGT